MSRQPTPASKTASPVTTPVQQHHADPFPTVASNHSSRAGTPANRPVSPAADEAALEAEKLAREEAARAEAAKLEAERAEAERMEAMRVMAQRLLAERAEAAKLEAERAEAAKLEADRAEAERMAREQEAARVVLEAAALKALEKQQAAREKTPVRVQAPVRVQTPVREQTPVRRPSVPSLDLVAAARLNTANAESEPLLGQAEQRPSLCVRMMALLLQAQHKVTNAPAAFATAVRANPKTTALKTALGLTTLATIIVWETALATDNLEEQQKLDVGTRNNAAGRVIAVVAPLGVAALMERAGTFAGRYYENRRVQRAAADAAETRSTASSMQAV